MKILIVGACLLTFICCTPKEAEVRTEPAEVRTEPTDQTKIRAKASNHNYEEEFLIKRAVEVKKKKVTKTEKPIAKKVKPKAKVVKKETTKPASQKEAKPKISITAKTSTPPKAETKPKVSKTSAPAKTKTKPKVSKTKPKVSKTSTQPKTKADPKVSTTAKTPSPPKTETKPKVSVTAKTSAPPKTESTPKKTKEISFKLSFYTTLPEHNGGYTKTASGESIVGLKNVVASNYYPLGTKIYLEGFGTVRVADRGGPDFNSSIRLDVLIQRKSGESNKEYAARVWDMGRQTISGYIVK